MAERKFPTWATGNAQLVNGDPNKDDPGLVKQALGWVIEKPLVQYMNWILNLTGTWIKANNEMPVVLDQYEAKAGETVLLNNSSLPATGKLPADPIDRQKVTFGGTTVNSTNLLTVEGNGNDIMETGVDAVVLDFDGRMVEFTWDSNSTLWELSVGYIRGKL